MLKNAVSPYKKVRYGNAMPLILHFKINIFLIAAIGCIYLIKIV